MRSRSSCWRSGGSFWNCSQRSRTSFFFSGVSFWKRLLFSKGGGGGDCGSSARAEGASSARQSAAAESAARRCLARPGIVPFLEHVELRDRVHLGILQELEVADVGHETHVGVGRARSRAGGRGLGRLGRRR